MAVTAGAVRAVRGVGKAVRGVKVPVVATAFVGQRAANLEGMGSCVAARGAVMKVTVVVGSTAPAVQMAAANKAAVMEGVEMEGVVTALVSAAASLAAVATGAGRGAETKVVWQGMEQRAAAGMVEETAAVVAGSEAVIEVELEVAMWAVVEVAVEMAATGTAPSRTSARSSWNGFAAGRNLSPYLVAQTNLRAGCRISTPSGRASSSRPAQHPGT